MTLRHYVCCARRKSRRCPWNVVSCTQPAGQENDFELIPRVQIESQYSVGWQTCHDFPRFVIISDTSRPEAEVVEDGRPKVAFLEKSPLTFKFSKMFSKMIHGDIDPRLVCKFREIWLTGNRQSRALFTGQKKTKFRLALPLSLSHESRPKSARASSRQYTQSAQNFIRIRIRALPGGGGYSRTREHRWNAPQSVSNTRRSFFDE